MNHPPPLTSAWAQWLSDNLTRGCSAESLVAAMVKSGFSPASAQQHVDQAQARSPQPASTHAQPRLEAAYTYDTPRFALTGNRIVTHDREVRVAMRLAQPVVALLDNLMSHEECDELVRLSSIKLKRSAVVDPETGRDQVIDERSSYGTFFHRNESEFIARLDRRIAEVMHWPVENGEGIQILHYPVGGEYRPHFDYFPPDEPGSQAHLARGGQRVSTLVMYLNDVDEGGQTSFPSINLAITPKKGAAAYFEYCNGQGQVDALTLHAGEPVVRGEKWIATKWMRQQRYA